MKWALGALASGNGKLIIAPSIWGGDPLKAK
jgi:hypothetical protein